MMDCSRIKDLISIYIDGELDEGQKARFEAHVDQCPLCKEELDDILEVLRMLRSMPEVDLPDNFREELHEKLVQVKEREFTAGKLFNIRNRYIRALSTIAAGALIVFVLKGIFFDGFFSGTKQDRLTKSESMSQSATVNDIGEKTGARILADEEKNKSAVEDKKEEEVRMFGFSENEENDKSAEAPEIMISRATPEVSNEIVSENILFSERGRIKVFVIVRDNVIDEGIIKSIATDSGATFKTYDTYDFSSKAMTEADVEDKNATAEVDVKEKSGAKDISDTKDEIDAKDENIVEFTIPGNRYQYFLNNLEHDVEYLKANIDYASPIMRQDIEIKLNELNVKLEGINRQIAEIESNQECSNPAELEKLKSQREDIEKEIGELLENSEYIADVVINVSK
ncbi:MAG: zf-HC2 domain-containing protein [Firmicutes bacterium]|nr:zf-HC2 domain-containing protein [Bacillota bacterium]